MARVLVRELLALLLAAVIVVGLFSAGWWARGVVEAFNEWRETPIVVGEPEPPLSITVRSGDTLWDIARAFYPNDRWDTRHIVAVIRRMNPDLDPARLQPGRDVVYLPRVDDL